MKKRHLFWMLAPVLLIVVPILAACTGTTPPAATTTPVTTTTPITTTTPVTTTPAATEVQIRIWNFLYDPEVITVAVGTTLIWTNYDYDLHSVDSDDKPPVFSSGDMFINNSFSYTFSEAGTYKYFCRPHPEMLGTVIVE